LKNRVRAGVPTHFRLLLWQCLAGVNSSSSVASLYSTLITMSSPCDKAIQRDVTRTYPEHDLFKDEHAHGQKSLFNVIKVCQHTKVLVEFVHIVLLTFTGIFIVRS
jgi:hypothetical protein